MLLCVGTPLPKSTKNPNLAASHSTPVNQQLHHIKFENQQNPKSTFDLVRLEDIPNLPIESHSPFESHVVGFYLILLMDAGTGSHTIDFTEYDCVPGTVLTVRKDQIHHFQQSATLRYTRLETAWKTRCSIPALWNH